MKAKRYGVKAYGNWFCFDTKKKYREFLEAWIEDTEGSERDRAVSALTALEAGECKYDSDL